MSEPKSVKKGKGSLKNKLATAFFAFNSLAAGSSALLYYFRPEGAIKHFNGTVTPTSKWWCMAVAGGDAVIAYLCATAALSDSAAVKILTLRATALYTYFHMGAFIHGDKMEKHPPANSKAYVPSMVISTAALIYWGYWNKLTDTE
jgi:hypothetical protein